MREHGSVATAARAPMTEKKVLLIEDGQSRMERAVRALAGLARDHKHMGENAGLVGAVIVPTDVEDWLTIKFPKYNVPAQPTLRRWLLDGGMVQAGKQLNVDGQMQRVCLPRQMPSDSWLLLKGYRAKPSWLFPIEEPM